MRLFQFPAQKQLLSLLLLMFMLIGCSNPVRAGDQVSVPAKSPAAVVGTTKIDPKLEQQILDVIRQHPEVILESVEKYQRDEQTRQAKSTQDLIGKIAANPKAYIAGSPTLGKGKAVLIEFSDFQCPFCAKARDNVKQFMDQRSADVTLVYKHLPLNQIHPEATPAAKSAWAAQQQGKFWPFHDALFTGQKQLGDSFYQATAKQLGLDMAKFNRDRASKAAEAAIRQDTDLATKLGLNGTPAFILNGEIFSGAVPVEELEKRLSAVK
jgi:protein-disulfide isomerase